MYKISKVNVLKIITLMLVIIWMSLLFYFSNQPSNKSTIQSSSVIEKILNIFPNIKKMDYVSKQNLIQNIQPYIRKMAHFTLYALGGIIIMSHIFLYKNIKYTKTISCMIGIAYAITDEIHQIFISGRSGQITDILIDSSGIIVGVLFIFTIVKFVEKWGVIKYA